MAADSLNPEQRLAVTTTEGPVLVLAGAGSGKTRVITHRVEHLLGLGVPPEAVVALSFTNKAAGEMRTRLQRMVGVAVADALVLGTFHSLGAWMLREDPRGFGLSGRGFSILDQGDVFGLVRSVLRQQGVHLDGERRYDLGAVGQRISRFKNAFLTADQVEARTAEDEYEEAAAAIYREYEDRLRAMGALDFDDLVCRVASGLAEDPETAARWRARFAYLMVDEYQDTNPAQFELLRGLLPASLNLCVVGDDDQAIYGFRGADVAHILSFSRQFPGAKVIKLVRNYRSQAHVVEAANAVILHNRDRHEKTLVPARPSGAPVRAAVARTGIEESRWVGAQIFGLVRERNLRADRIAVLYRSAIQVKPIEVELQAHGIAYRVLGGQALYDRKEVKDALSYLRVLVTPRDDLAVRRALDTPPRGIGAKTVATLQGFAAEQRISLLEAVGRHREVEGIGGRPGEALAGFSAQIERARGIWAGHGRVRPALQGLLDEIGLRDQIRRETGSDRATELRWDGVTALLDGLDRYQDNAGKRLRWSDYLGKLALDRDTGEDPGTGEGRVTLATIHSAKGLEWDHVFLIGCEEGQIPHRRVFGPRSVDLAPGDLEEERRLFYVGMTRAREHLTLSRAECRIDRGREQPCAPSRFLAELPTTGVETYTIATQEQLTGDAVERMADALLSRLRVS